MKHRKNFTLVEIMIVVAIIGLLAAIAVPSFMQARTSAQENACMNNQRQINGAIQQWMLQEGKTSSDVSAPGSGAATTWGDYIDGEIPECPVGGQYGLDGDNKATCSAHDQVGSS